ncbi:hypothetical protein F5Y15DRAFT_58396 [Xylariaceae sp. FL0016]|nr:hypothetical protein F5Y15DRAFT_58396 [Xylariaceae sp. FL0016]
MPPLAACRLIILTLIILYLHTILYSLHTSGTLLLQECINSIIGILAPHRVHFDEYDHYGWLTLSLGATPPAVSSTAIACNERTVYLSHFLITGATPPSGQFKRRGSATKSRATAILLSSTTSAVLLFP